MDWEARKQKRLFKEFYEKTGIQLTDEPIIESHLEDEFTKRFYWQAQERPNAVIPELEKLVEQHTTIPSLKNFLYAAYVRSGKKEKANDLLAVSYTHLTLPTKA